MAGYASTLAISLTSVPLHVPRKSFPRPSAAANPFESIHRIEREGGRGRGKREEGRGKRKRGKNQGKEREHIHSSYTPDPIIPVLEP